LVRLAQESQFWESARQSSQRFNARVLDGTDKAMYESLPKLCNDHTDYIFLGIPEARNEVAQRWIRILKHWATLSAEASDADLLVAARNGDPRLVEQLLAQGASVNAREQKPPNVGRTPLHYTAGGYNLPGPALHLEVARLLVEKGADVNAKAEGGYTPLHVASGLRNTSMVSFLLSKGADPNAVDKHGTPLTAAVLQGHLEIVRLLLKAGANPDIPGELGRPIDMIHWAANWYPEHDAIFSALIEARADVKPGAKGNNPLYSAVSRGRTKVALAMIDAGAIINGAVVEVAGARADRQVVDALIRRNPKIFAGEGLGSTVLHGAVCSEDAAFFDWVLKRTPDVNARGNEGKTPLHGAARCDNAAAIRALIARGADVNRKDDKGGAPINQLYGVGLVPSLEVLLDAGADPDIESGGSTPLMNGVYMNDAEFVRVLVARGADVNRKSRGATALHEAVRLENLGPAAALLESKQLRVDERNDRGQTALHLAVRVGGAQLVAMLLKRGADPTLRTPEGKTARQLAEEHGGKPTVELPR
jgi:ankyrin repeat protein